MGVFLYRFAVPFVEHFFFRRTSLKHCLRKLSDVTKTGDNLELFWSAFFRIRTEYGEIRENADQNNSEYSCNKSVNLGDI